MSLTLRWNRKARHGKRAFVVANQNDGWRDLRIEVDTDDCDSDFAIQAMQTVIDRVNLAPELYEACKLLLMCSLPNDVSGVEMVNKAKAAVDKFAATLQGVEP